MLKKYNRHSLLIILIFAVVLILITVLINLPFFFRAQKINKKLSTLTAEQDSSSVGLTLEQLKELENKITAYESQFPKVGTELDLILKLENLAKNSQIIQKLTFNQTKKKSNEHLVTVTTNIELEGGYSGIMNYLAQIKTLKPQISVQSVDLEQSSPTLLKATITAETYWLK